ncbi:serine hydrolase domain-containing protein [Chryseosolibacter indicus]|uniref:Serine hydrolase n=1 Tax=Chryseosolibacter indicus TaxID=2782351 RepID=A0ABS5VLF0_9BACT|nr:serine hydrolase domain-containing protein [Chryseosolibacter indicus]MBT1701828.1 serine hydrolase [Chryseosolibacter indicus]
MLKKTSITVATLWIAISFNTTAQNITDRIDSYYTNLADKGELNANVLVAENGKIIYQKSFGYADFENRRLNNNTSEFNLASISKVFTAVSILQLKEKGKLSLDDNFAKYFPDFPYPTITIRQMLSHTSGLSDQDLSGMWDRHKEKNPDKIITNKDLVQVLVAAKASLKLKPGEKWWYCNFAFTLLASLTEKLSGEKFNEYIDRHIFKPAGMTHTYPKTALLNVSHSPDLSYNYDYPFRYSNDRINFVGEKRYYNGIAMGASDVISTTGDLLKFDIALYNGVLLDSKTLEEAFRPTKLTNGDDNVIWLNIGGMGKAYDGLGWFIFADTTAGKIVWHTGGMPGCATIFLRNVSKKQTVIVLDNTNSEGVYKKALSAMYILNGKPGLIAKKSLTKIYGKALMAKGADNAFTRLLELKDDTTHYSLIENDMNNLGYEFLENGHTAQALETLKINTLLFPQSDNVYNSYGEALEKDNKLPEALLMFKKSIILNPSNEDSKNAVKRIQTNQTQIKH